MMRMLDDFEYIYCLIYYQFFVFFFVMAFYRALLENTKLPEIVLIYLVVILISLLTAVGEDLLMGSSGSWRNKISYD